MNTKNAFITSGRALAKNKMRSALTSIGIIIGVSSVIVMIGLGNSAQIAVRNKVFSYGSNGMAVKTGVHQVTNSDIITLKKHYYQIEYITPVAFKKNVLTKFRRDHINSRLFGVNHQFLRIRGRKLKKGRFFSAGEVVRNAKVAVIGPSQVKELFGNKNPIGQQIILDQFPVKVIGVMETAGSSFGGTDFDNVIIIPFTTANSRIFKKRTFWEFYVSANSAKNVEETKNLIHRYLRRKFNYHPGKEDNFKIMTSKEKQKIANDISGALSILLAGIASISLFVGGVGIMNIMLVSVTERTREIGIRMAIGAKKRDIMMQFIIESVTLSTIGGFVGILLGLGIYYIIIIVAEWPFIFSLFSILISFLFAAAVGIFFGYYPARKASALKPIDALKFE